MEREKTFARPSRTASGCVDCFQNDLSMASIQSVRKGGSNVRGMRLGEWLRENDVSGRLSRPLLRMRVGAATWTLSLAFRLDHCLGLGATVGDALQLPSTDLFFNPPNGVRPGNIWRFLNSQTEPPSLDQFIFY
jgi:hypothetical protein